MAYSDFNTLSKFKKAFNLRIDEESDLSNFYIKYVDKIRGILAKSVQD